MRNVVALMGLMMVASNAWAQVAPVQPQQPPPPGSPSLTSPAMPPQVLPSHRGQWMTEGGKSRVEVSDCGPQVCAKIVWLKDPNDDKGKPLHDAYNKNTQMRNRPILGLPLFENMRPARAGWEGRSTIPRKATGSTSRSGWRPPTRSTSRDACCSFAKRTPGRGRPQPRRRLGWRRVLLPHKNADPERSRHGPPRYGGGLSARNSSARALMPSILPASAQDRPSSSPSLQWRYQFLNKQRGLRHLVGIIVIQPQILADVLKCEAEIFSTQDEIHPRPVAPAVDACALGALGRDQAAGLVEADGPRGYADLGCQFADRPARSCAPVSGLRCGFSELVSTQKNPLSPVSVRSAEMSYDIGVKRLHTAAATLLSTCLLKPCCGQMRGQALPKD